MFGRISRKDEAGRTIAVVSRVISIGENTRILAADKTPLAFGSLAVGASVSVTGKTFAGILDADKDIRLSDLKVGHKVKAKGQQQPDGSFLAALVYVVSPAPPK